MGGRGGIAPIVRHRPSKSIQEPAHVAAADSYGSYDGEGETPGAAIPERVFRANCHEEIVRNHSFHFDDVMCGELSDFLPVRLKRVLGGVHPDLFADELAEKDDETAANPARYARLPRKKKQLAHDDYERRLATAFREAARVLRGKES